MAGRKQHHIPQSLLRGFEAARTGKQSQVYVYRLNQDPYLSSVEGVAAQRHFYSQPSDASTESLDDVITAYEDQRFTGLLNKLRNNGAATTIDPQVAAEVVSHLTVRAAFIRKSFQNLAHQILDETSQLISDEKRLRSYLSIDEIQLHAMLEEEIDDQILRLKTALPKRVPSAFIKRVAVFVLREKFSSFFNMKTTQAESDLVDYESNLFSISSNAHKKILANSVAPKEIIDSLSGLNWRILNSTKANLILPDCLAIAQLSPNDFYEPFILSERSFVDQILMPISSGQLLVGSKSSRSPISFETFNKSAALCSLEFFVSPVQTNTTSTLSESIGEKAKLFYKDIVQDSFYSMAKSTPKASQKSVPNDIEKIASFFNFEFSFIACANQENAEKIVAVFKSVLVGVASQYDLNRIDSVIFSADYQGTLTSLERGFNSDPLIASAGSAAMAPLVIREGQIKCCLVFESWIGYALISSDAQTVSEARYTVEKMLARVAFIEVIDEVLPQVLLKRFDNAWNTLIFGRVQNIFSVYFSARVAAASRPSIKNFYAESLNGSLISANDIIPSARLAYQQNHDLDGFIRITGAAFEAILTNAAALIGHTEGLNELAFYELDDTLKSLNMSDWMTLLERDLKDLFARFGVWSSYDDFLRFSVHVERLYWQFGVFPWQTDDGNVWFEIPDLSLLPKQPPPPTTPDVYPAP